MSMYGGVEKKKTMHRIDRTNKTENSERKSQQPLMYLRSSTLEIFVIFHLNDFLLKTKATIEMWTTRTIFTKLNKTIIFNKLFVD